MEPELNAVILAAGFGKRMKSALPKPLHPILGLPMIEYSLRAVAAVTPRPPVIVIGHGAEQIRQTLEGRARFALQAEQLGTAHALRMAGPLLADQGGLVLLSTSGWQGKSNNVTSGCQVSGWMNCATVSSMSRTVISGRSAC